MKGDVSRGQVTKLELEAAAVGRVGAGLTLKK
jgi:hypothetical protein